MAAQRPTVPIRVPLAEVRIVEGGGEPYVYQLEGEAIAQVPEEEVARFLLFVPGAEVVQQAAKPAAKGSE